MKKFFYFAAIAGLVLSGCSKQEYLGDVQKTSDNSQILFSSGAKPLTKADHTGADAAGLLGNNFVVEGIKGDGSTQTEVFDHYNVNYTASTANTTESNTANWEYVGQTKHSLSAAPAQTIKYWDYSAKQYDFVAFSYGTSNATNLTLTEMKYANLGNDGIDHTSDPTPGADETEAVYTVTGSATELSKAYIADLVTVYNRDGVSEYGTTVVTPKFRSLGTKVRLAFYETVPGYAVSNVKFYDAAWDGSTATSADGSATPTLFAANAIFPSATTTGTMNVYYPTVGFNKSGKDGNPADADYNQAHITFTADTGSGNELVETKTFAALKYTASKEGAEKCTNILGRSSSTATYAGDVTATAHAFEMVLPLGTKDNIQLRIEYDLYPIDGGEEVIHVRDARAVVPAAYAEWKPNYAYTYIFKISDATNGWTGVDGSGNVVEGLTPITFDAVVVDTEDGVQETITTVTTPSITTYQAGKVVTTNDEYKAGDIFVSVEGNPVLSSTNAHLYIVTSGTATEATAALAIKQGKSDPSTDVFDKTAVELTQVYPVAGDYVTSVPSADGNTLAVNALRIGGAASTTYVFEYVNGTNKTYKVIKVQ